MAPLALMQIIFLLTGQVIASPLVGPHNEYAEHAVRGRSTLNIKQTTTTEHNVIDWVLIEAQGSIASPPPSPLRVSSNSGAKPMAELQKPDADVGPPNTVPIPRAGIEYLNNVARKSLPGESFDTTNLKRQNSGAHWYVSANKTIANQGGFAVFSLFSPFVKSNDYSVIQTAIAHNSSAGRQTVEAGWISYPTQITKAHLFTFFSVNGRSKQGANLGGWNRDVAGWVQTDNLIFPGTVFSSTSVDGGDQYEMEIEYQLYEDNWWLWVLDRWIGYYPASLFSTNITGTTLATGSDTIYYYGEVLQDEGELTSTDMGSGRFGTTGPGHSAYIHNMTYQVSGKYLDFTAPFWDSDPTRYNHLNGTNTTWGSYVYLGGPGAGNITGS